MAQDLDSARIANAITDSEEHDRVAVTKEMIEAGVIELAAYNSEFESDDDAVCRIYRAMIKEGRRGAGMAASRDAI